MASIYEKPPHFCLRKGMGQETILCNKLEPSPRDMADLKSRASIDYFALDFK
jgi:hypothetical protein